MPHSNSENPEDMFCVRTVVMVLVWGQRAERSADFCSCGAEESSRQAAWAEALLAEARAMLDLPALARGDAMLMQATKLANTFTCQPQQRNMHGRVFGGFLMRWGPVRTHHA